MENMGFKSYETPLAAGDQIYEFLIWKIVKSGIINI